MSDAEVENLAADAFDDSRFADTIRMSVRDAVEAALAKVVGSADTRREGRAAGTRLGNALVANAEAAKHTGTSRHLQPRAANPGPVTVDDDSEGRARTFRVMAGVHL